MVNPKRFSQLVLEGKTVRAIRKLMGGLAEYSDAELLRKMLEVRVVTIDGSGVVIMHAGGVK